MRCGEQSAIGNPCFATGGSAIASWMTSGKGRRTWSSRCPSETAQTNLVLSTSIAPGTAFGWDRARIDMVNSPTHRSRPAINSC